VNRPLGVLRDVISTVHGAGLRGRGPTRAPLMLGTILIASLVSGAVFFVLTQYCSVDVFSSLGLVAADCFPNWEVRLGSGIFDWLSTVDDRRRAVGICVSFAPMIVTPNSTVRMISMVRMILTATTDDGQAVTSGNGSPRWCW